MSKFFKNMFAEKNKKWQRKKGKKSNSQPMEVLIREFAEEQFGKFMRPDSLLTINNLIKPLTLILHSHRYKKQEEFTKNLDFSIIRDLLYCYSNEARTRFMEHPIFAFLFKYFYRNNFEEFIRTNSENESEEYSHRLVQELDELFSEACNLS